MECPYDIADHARYDDRLNVVPLQKITEALSRACVFGVEVDIGISAKSLSRVERARPYSFKGQVFRRLYSGLLHISSVG